MVRPSYPSEYDKSVAYRAALESLKTNYPQMSTDQRMTVAWSSAAAIYEHQVLPLLSNLSEIDNALTRAGVPEIVTTSEHPDFIDRVASRLSNLDLGLFSAHEANQLHEMLSKVGIAFVTATGESLSLSTRLQLMIDELLGWRLGAEAAAHQANVALPTERIVIDSTMVLPLAETMERVAQATPEMSEATQLGEIYKSLKELIATHVVLACYLDELRASLANGSSSDQAFVKRVGRQFSKMQTNLERLHRAQQVYAKAAELSKREAKVDSNNRAIINRLLSQAEQLSNGPSLAMYERLDGIRAAITKAHSNDKSLMTQMNNKFTSMTVAIVALQSSLQIFASNAGRYAQEASDRDKVLAGEFHDHVDRTAQRQQAETGHQLATLRDAIVNRLGDDAVLIRQLDSRLSNMQADIARLESTVHAYSQDAQRQNIQTRDEQVEVRRLIGQLTDTVARLSDAVTDPNTEEARRLIQEALDTSGGRRVAQNFPLALDSSVPLSTASSVVAGTMASVESPTYEELLERLKSTRRQATASSVPLSTASSVVAGTMASVESPTCEELLERLKSTRRQVPVTTRPAPVTTRPAPVNTRPAPVTTRPAPTKSHRERNSILVILTILVLFIIGSVVVTEPLTYVLGVSTGAGPQLVQEQLGEKFPALFQNVNFAIKSDTEQAQAVTAFASYSKWLKKSKYVSGGLMVEAYATLETSKALRWGNDGSLDRAYGLRKDGTKLAVWKTFLGMLATEKTRLPKALQTPSRRTLLDNTLRDISAWIRGYQPPSVRSAPSQPLFTLPTLQQQYATVIQSVTLKIAGNSRPCINPQNLAYAMTLLPPALVKAHACPVHHLTPALLTSFGRMLPGEAQMAKRDPVHFWNHYCVRVERVGPLHDEYNIPVSELRFRACTTP